MLRLLVSKRLAMSLFRLLLCLPVILVPLAKAADRAVFAHYMVSNSCIRRKAKD